MKEFDGLQKKREIKVFRGKDVKNVPDKLVEIVKKTMQEKNLPAAIIVDMKAMSASERERFVNNHLKWLFLAQKIDAQDGRCADCGYLWIPQVDIHSVPRDEVYNEDGMPRWRDNYKRNPARENKEGKLICRLCYSG